MSAETGERAQVLADVPATVELVAHDLMRDVAHVHANLMRATRVEMALKKRVALVARTGLKALERREGGYGLARARLFRPRPCAARSRLDRAMPCRDAPRLGSHVAVKRAPRSVGRSARRRMRAWRERCGPRRPVAPTMRPTLFHVEAFTIAGTVLPWKQAQEWS